MRATVERTQDLGGKKQEHARLVAERFGAWRERGERVWLGWFCFGRVCFRVDPAGLGVGCKPSVYRFDETRQPVPLASDIDPPPPSRSAQAAVSFHGTHHRDPRSDSRARGKLASTRREIDSIPWPMCHSVRNRLWVCVDLDQGMYAATVLIHVLGMKIRKRPARSVVPATWRPGSARIGRRYGVKTR